MSTPLRRQPALVLVAALVAVLAAPLSGVPVAGAAASGHHGHHHRHHHGHHLEHHHGHHQSVSVTVLPGVRQTGPTPEPSRGAQTVVAATIRPQAQGRPVRLQKRHGHTWRNVDRSRTAGRGKVAFMVPRPRHGRLATYRVVALHWHGYRAAHSRPVVDRWGAPDFVDEFDGPSLSDAWEHRISFYNPWGGRACSKGDPRAVAVSGGVLRLSSMPDPDVSDPCPVKDKTGRPLGSFPYRLNGHISTQHSADFLYGVAAARMRFPRSLGQHAAFWLQPRGLLDTGTTPWGAEVDVVEWYGARGRNPVMASAVHEPMPDGSKREIGGMIPRPDRFLATRTDSWWDRYHVFSLEWTPSHYVFRIAGHEVWRTHQGVSHVPEFLILSMLSSDFELPDVGRDPTPRTAEVDWVAFWQAGRG